MAQPNNTENYLNGIFIQLKEGTSKQGVSYSFQRMGIKVDELIKSLKSFKQDERGFVNFTISTQKGDKSKYSVSLDTFVPTGPSIGNRGGSPAPSRNSQSSSATDDLPF